MQTKFDKVLKATLLVVMLTMTIGTYAQTPEKQTKIEKKQAEQERRDREKQAREEAKRQKEEDKAKAYLEKLIPIGKDVEYDRFKDITTVSTKGMVVVPNGGSTSFTISNVGMWALYSVQGQFGNAPPMVRLYFYGQTVLIGTPNNPCSLSMILNGSNRIQFGQMSYGRTIQLGNIAWVDMPLSNFRSLATSTSIDVQTCRFETALNDRHISGLAALLDGLPQATATRPAITAPSKVNGFVHPHVGTWTFQMMRDGVPEDWVLQISGESGALKGILKIGKGGEVILSNILSSNSFLSGGAHEIVKGGMNMVTFSGQTSDNIFSGKITFWLLGKQQAPIAFEAKRTSIP